MVHTYILRKSQANINLKKRKSPLLITPPFCANLCTYFLIYPLGGPLLQSDGFSRGETWAPHCSVPPTKESDIFTCVPPLLGLLCYTQCYSCLCGDVEVQGHRHLLGLQQDKRSYQAATILLLTSHSI